LFIRQYGGRKGWWEVTRGRGEGEGVMWLYAFSLGYVTDMCGVSTILLQNY